MHLSHQDISIYKEYATVQYEFGDLWIKKHHQEQFIQIQSTFLVQEKTSMHHTENKNS